MTTTGTPNLDDTDDDELRNIIRDVQRSPSSVADLWWGRADATALDLATGIAKYAAMLLNARIHRREGRIDRALTLENALEFRRNELPQYARW